MPSRELIVEPRDYYDAPVLHDLAEIRRHNPQRFEMEQLTAIVHEDPENHLCVAYKDLTEHEFWVRGHMPGMPLMPGVLMLEAAAQACGYYTHKHRLLGDNVTVGFGGIDQVRFRDPVRPGNRLLIAAQLTKIRPKMMCVCHFQEFVGESLVCEGTIKGIALPTAELTGAAN